LSFTYDPTNLDTTTSSGRLNSVRLLIGDTDAGSPQVQDEEVTFALLEEGDNVYSAASWVAKTIAAKYARYVDVDLDGQLAEDYSQLQKHYSGLAKTLSDLANEKKASLGIVAGGVNSFEVALNRRIPTRPKGFYIGQFDNDGEGNGYL